MDYPVDIEAIVLIGNHLVALMYAMCLFMAVFGVVTTIVFIKLLRRSEERLDHAHDVVNNLVSATNKMEDTLNIITRAYEGAISRLEKSRDTASETALETAKQNSILSAVATAPRTTINNN